MMVGEQKQKRSFLTFMRCEECSSDLMNGMFFCNVTKKGIPVLCHIVFHKLNCNNAF
jgi:hypothetical protein